MVGRYDFRGLETWSLAPHAPVLCFGHDFVQKNSSVGAWLEKNLQEKALVAILNWVGVRPTPSCEPLRLCSTISDARGTKPSLESHIRENLKLSSTVHRYAAQFLAEHQLQSYNAVQMRAEMVLHHRYLSASCNDSGVYTWFSSLKELFSNKETWFRARDLKKGGSSTLQWFDNQSRNTLMRLEAEVWQSSPATFLDYDCTSLSPVMCLLVDVALLSGAERLVLLGGSGGVAALVRTERLRRRKPLESIIHSMLHSEGCSPSMPNG